MSLMNREPMYFSRKYHKKQNTSQDKPVTCPLGVFGGCQLRMTELKWPSITNGVRSLGAVEGAESKKILFVSKQHILCVAIQTIQRDYYNNILLV